MSVSHKERNSQRQQRRADTREAQGGSGGTCRRRWSSGEVEATTKMDCPGDKRLGVAALGLRRLCGSATRASGGWPWRGNMAVAPERERGRIRVSMSMRVLRELTEVLYGSGEWPRRSSDVYQRRCGEVVGGDNLERKRAQMRGRGRLEDAHGERNQRKAP